MGDTLKIGHRGTRFLACAVVFILWGGSFLAVRESVLVAPPFLAAAFRLCAEHVRQLEGASPFHNLMEVK